MSDPTPPSYPTAPPPPPPGAPVPQLVGAPAAAVPTAMAVAPATRGDVGAPPVWTGMPPQRDAGLTASTRPQSLGRGLAVTSLVLGCAAIALSPIAIVDYLGVLVAVAGLAIGILALASRTPGRGFAIAGTAVSAAALVVSVIAAFALTSVVAKGVEHNVAKAVEKQLYSGLGDDSGDESYDDGSGDDGYYAYTFGTSAGYDDGVEIVVDAPTKYVATADSSTADQRTSIQFTVTVRNETRDELDPLLSTEVWSGADELDGTPITDPTTGVGIPDRTAIPAGATKTYTYAFSVADARDVTVEVAPGYEYDYYDFGYPTSTGSSDEQGS